MIGSERPVASIETGPLRHSVKVLPRHVNRPVLGSFKSMFVAIVVVRLVEFVGTAAPASHVHIFLRVKIRTTLPWRVAATSGNRDMFVRFTIVVGDAFASASSGTRVLRASLMVRVEIGPELLLIDGVVRDSGLADLWLLGGQIASLRRLAILRSIGLLRLGVVRLVELPSSFDLGASLGICGRGGRLGSRAHVLSPTPLFLVVLFGGLRIWLDKDSWLGLLVADL